MAEPTTSPACAARRCAPAHHLDGVDERKGLAVGLVPNVDEDGACICIGGPWPCGCGAHDTHRAIHYRGQHWAYQCGVTIMTEDIAKADELAAAALAYIQSGRYPEGREPPDALEQEHAALDAFKLALAHYRKARGLSRGFTCRLQ